MWECGSNEWETKMAHCLINCTAVSILGHKYQRMEGVKEMCNRD